MLRRKSSAQRLEEEKSAALAAAAKLGLGVTSDHHSLMADTGAAAALAPAAAAVAGGGGGGGGGGAAARATEPVDLTAVRRDLAESLHDRSHDDGSLGPLILRFAWHNAGTFDKDKRTGGTNGCTMRFPKERADPENAGFDKAVAAMEKVHSRHPYLSKADLYALAGTVAIEAMGGPAIPFQTGRQDWGEAQAVERNGPTGCPFGDGAHNPCGSRLPAADLGPAPDAPRGCPMHVKEKPTIDAIRGTFTRMGFDAKETVCLIVLGHQFGRCHADVSGNEHPYADSIYYPYIQPAIQHASQPARQPASTWLIVRSCPHLPCRTVAAALARCGSPHAHTRFCCAGGMYSIRLIGTCTIMAWAT